MRCRRWLAFGRLALQRLPGLLVNGRHRQALRQMWAFSRQLPARLAAPLPESMRELTPAATGPTLPETTLRQLADLVALLDRRSPLGLCLRRSLIRYHFLRRAGLPLAVQFGAKFVPAQPSRQIAGHAWVTLNGRPYHEPDENWRYYTVVYRWPV